VGIQIDLRPRKSHGNFLDAIRGKTPGQFMGEIFGLVVGKLRCFHDNSTILHHHLAIPLPHQFPAAMATIPPTAVRSGQNLSQKHIKARLAKGTSLASGGLRSSGWRLFLLPFGLSLEMLGQWLWQ